MPRKREGMQKILKIRRTCGGRYLNEYRDFIKNFIGSGLTQNQTPPTLLILNIKY